MVHHPTSQIRPSIESTTQHPSNVSTTESATQNPLNVSTTQENDTSENIATVTQDIPNTERRKWGRLINWAAYALGVATIAGINYIMVNHEKEDIVKTNTGVDIQLAPEARSQIIFEGKKIYLDEIYIGKMFGKDLFYASPTIKRGRLTYIGPHQYIYTPLDPNGTYMYLNTDQPKGSQERIRPATPEEIKKADQAMTGQAQPDAVMTPEGGIDFKSDKVDSAFEVKRDPSEKLGTRNEYMSPFFQFHIDPAMLQQLQNSPGFMPVIINIQPMNNLPEFLGLSQQIETFQTAGV